MSRARNWKLKFPPKNLGTRANALFGSSISADSPINPSFSHHHCRLFTHHLSKLHATARSTMGYSREASDSPKVIIFDWDDTICPSSFFDRHQLDKEELPQRVSQDLQSGSWWMGSQSVRECFASVFFPFLQSHLTPCFVYPAALVFASQYHKLFGEIGRCAEKCLHEASKYGEVR